MKRVPKQYRKYLKFSRYNLNELIDSDSYVFYKSGKYLLETDKYHYTKLHQEYFTKFTGETINANIYKHKTKEEYLLRISKHYCELYIYALDEDIKCINRENLPAIIQYDSFKYKDSCWFEYISNNIRHRSYGPQSFEYIFSKDNEDASIYLKYFQNDKMHRVNGPSYIYIYNERFNVIEYFINGELIKNKPNKIQYTDCNGNIAIVTIFHDDDSYEYYLFHYCYDCDCSNSTHKTHKIINTITTHQYWKNISLHNMIGPSVIAKNYETKEINKTWYINGKKLPDDIIKFENNIPLRKITKQDIVEAMLFDREYGTFVKNYEATCNTNPIVL